MLQKTKALILHSTKYSDNAMIIHAYTEEFGRVSYIVNGRKGKKTGFSLSLLQPLSVLDLEVEHHEKKDLQRIKEGRLSVVYTTIPFDANKSSVAFFMAELLYRALKETHQDKTLFAFLQQSFCILDLTETSVANFHLVFLLKLTRFLGFYPNNKLEGEAHFFDLVNGDFPLSEPIHQHKVMGNSAKNIHQLLSLDYETMHQLQVNREERACLVEYLLDYYQLQLHEMFTIKSVEVLKAVFD